eukprot:c24500_g1_i1 orf=48-401(+)
MEGGEEQQQQQAQGSACPPALAMGEQRTFSSLWTARFLNIKEHWESYPYVWASYIFVFGTLGFYATYRWRKLRQAEDELLRLQGKVRSILEAERAARNPAGRSGEEETKSSASELRP